MINTMYTLPNKEIMLQLNNYQIWTLTALIYLVEVEVKIEQVEEEAGQQLVQVGEALLIKNSDKLKRHDTCLSSVDQMVQCS